MKKNEKKEELKNKSVYIRGALVDAMYGRKDFDKNGKDKFRYSIKVVPEDMESLVEAAEDYYSDTEERWIPKWFSDENSREFLNLSSNYDIKIGKRNDAGEIEDLGNCIDYIRENGNINGSKVIMLVTLKKDASTGNGAVYPVSMLIKELHQTSISDMFADFDEDDLPF